MDQLLQDLRFALRGLWRTKGFTAAAVIALALGIGATTAIFSVVNSVLLRSFGWGDEGRLVSVYRTYVGIGSGKGGLSVPELYDLQQAQSLESFGSFNAGSAALQGTDRAERVPVARVTSGFFSALGARPQLGRAFGPDEDLQGNDAVGLLSAAAFRRRFGGDPEAVGRSVTLDGRSRRIIGILPDGFAFNGAHEFFIPYGFTQNNRLVISSPSRSCAPVYGGIPPTRRSSSFRSASRRNTRTTTRPSSSPCSMWSPCAIASWLLPASPSWCCSEPCCWCS
jgi:putative ABC transport system permease protein